MTAPGKQLGWGSLLSQAVAGVESRLDTILAEGDAGQAPRRTTAAPNDGAKTVTRSSPVIPPFNAQSNDRLQAKLAKALANKTAPVGANTTARSSPRSSLDQASRGPGRPSSPSSAAEHDAAIPPEPGTSKLASESLQASADDDTVAQAPPAPADSVSREEVLTTPLVPEACDSGGALDMAPTTKVADEPGLTSEIHDLKTRHQEEIREYVERIDSLQSKLQYLSNLAVDAASHAASSASPGSLDRKLAEKDEKIALLMDEGRKLSGAEQQLRTTIKKLRSQMLELEKEITEVKKTRDKASSDAELLRQRLNDAEGSQKRHDEAMRATAGLQREIDALKRDKAKREEAYRRLEDDMKTKADKTRAASVEALTKAVAVEREKQNELQEAMNSLRTEKDLLMENLRRENLEWREKLDRAVERGRTIEEELKLELRGTESKLEAMRTAAEEASSGPGGEAQVKMLRQIETLQSQYASARENWQGIESSLLAKVTGIDREKDEAQHRESEMRRKARDAMSRCRQLEDELQEMRPALEAARQELEDCRSQLDTLRDSSMTAEAALQQARADLDKERQKSERDQVEGDQQAVTERRQWVDEAAGIASKSTMSRSGSPLLSMSRNCSCDQLGLQVPGRLRRGPASECIPDGLGEVTMTLPLRRLSHQQSMRTGAASSTGVSGLPPMPYSPFEPPSESSQVTSSVTEQENGADEGGYSSPRNLAQDMISASTVAAGPSVQLVERMSSAIRRLEAEKVAAKEEMARVCNQRDEARAEIVGLMKDLEEAKAMSARVPQLEEEVSSLDSRYQTTLEMLGEKSERVEELRADVEDVKAMYRELVERTVK